MIPNICMEIYMGNGDYYGLVVTEDMDFLEEMSMTVQGCSQIEHTEEDIFRFKGVKDLRNAQE